MDVRLDNKNGTPVAPLAEILSDLGRQLQHKQDAWRQRLREDPRQFGAVEVLTEVGQSQALEDACKKSR